MVRFAALQQACRILRINRQPFGLTVRAMVSAYVNSFIPVNPQPPKRSFDVFLGFAARPLKVRILDPQDQPSPVATGQQPVKQG
jgi:hypothetical protein